ncbi:uncharacterized protein B0T15DRAFT_505690 [Chaetomium strumarium]|uniref:Uncharacterized protein n=1 Tax=Chaetomium strumarium TaxID=1170767 RepID=A0AAJ0GMX9_9PEZI|nr:hypothetical protein B0T15DRAFT_505690 [Chaetomium strumarium]
MYSRSRFPFAFYRRLQDVDSPPFVSHLFHPSPRPRHQSSLLRWPRRQSFRCWPRRQFVLFWPPRQSSPFRGTVVPESSPWLVGARRPLPKPPPRRPDRPVRWSAWGASSPCWPQVSTAAEELPRQDDASAFCRAETGAVRRPISSRLTAVRGVQGKLSGEDADPREQVGRSRQARPVERLVGRGPIVAECGPVHGPLAGPVEREARPSFQITVRIVSP